MPPDLPSWIQMGAGAMACAILGLCTAIGVMWKAQQKQMGRVEKAAEDLVRRIRQLEDDRLSDARTHARDYHTLAMRVADALAANTNVLRDLVAVLRLRPCLADAEPRPQNLPSVHTESLERTK